MSVRIVTHNQGQHFQCCTTLFHGQLCPDCRTEYGDAEIEAANAEFAGSVLAAEPAPAAPAAELPVEAPAEEAPAAEEGEAAPVSRNKK